MIDSYNREWNLDEHELDHFCKTHKITLTIEYRERPGRLGGNSVAKVYCYTKTHFKNEERIMQQHNYIHLVEHQAEHNKFVAQVEDLYEKYKSGSLAITISLINFLKTWLVDHIQGSDKKFGLSVAK